MPCVPELDAKVEGMRKASSESSSRGEFSMGVPVSNRRCDERTAVRFL